MELGDKALTDQLLGCIYATKTDKSEKAVTLAANCITLLVAA